jgi:hypothetical protein
VPTIRDARGQLTEYRVEPIGSPPGPVERAQVSQARMADFAAERAARVAPAAPAPAPAKPKKRALNPERSAVRAERVARYLDAIRASDSHREAAERLGVGKHSLEMFVSDLRRRRELPDDVEELLRQRNPARGRHGGRPKANGAATPQTEPQGQEADVPATAVATVEQPDPEQATGVSTPPGPIAVIAQEYSGDEPTDTRPYLTVTVDCVALARAMDGWQTFQMTAFFEGLAKVVAEVNR